MNESRPVRWFLRVATGLAVTVGGDTSRVQTGWAVGGDFVPRIVTPPAQSVSQVDPVAAVAQDRGDHRRREGDHAHEQEQQRQPGALGEAEDDLAEVLGLGDEGVDGRPHVAAGAAVDPDDADGARDGGGMRTTSATSGRRRATPSPTACPGRPPWPP